MARGPIGGNQNQNQFTGGNLGGIFPASEVIVVRNTPCGQAFPIRVNINKALTDKRERILIQPGDVVIMQYTPAEKVGNALLSMINFQFLFNNGFQGF
jgi:hypothetical protein